MAASGGAPDELNEWGQGLSWGYYVNDPYNLFDGLNAKQIEAIKSIHRAMGYGVICEHDEDFMCIHRMQFIADELKKLNV
jgi:hypothetical protein